MIVRHAAARSRAQAADTFTPDRARRLRGSCEDERRSRCPRVGRSRAASQRASGPEASAFAKLRRTRQSLGV